MTHTPIILDKLQSVRQNGSGWTALCPAHEDRRSSLSISVGDDGRTLVHCHAGCTPEAIAAAVGFTLRDLAPPSNGHAGNGKPEIIATYDYRSEDGRLVFQVVRFHPKDFRQRKPKDGGGWDWKLGNVRRVPYRLPEILAADPSETIYIVEGEKDVEGLRRLGLVGTCNAGGAGKWDRAFNQYLGGRKVVILPDNDPPGRKHADEIASGLRGIAAELKIVALPGLPEKGDVSDWLAGGGTIEKLRQVVEAVEVLVTETPIARWKPFPVEVLPQPVRRYVERSAAAIGCDPAYVATAILPALAAAIGNSRVVLLKPGWTEPAVLWGVLVGDSGSQKSPAIDAATKHTKRRQAEAIEVYRLERQEYERQVELYKLAYDDWKRNGRKKGDLPPEEPVEPVCERFYVSDVTIEGLAPILAGSPRGLLLIRDEISGWVCGFDQYKGGRGGADTAHWLGIHGARDLVVDRKTGAERTIFVPKAAVSISGGIQPGTLRRVLGSEHFENGLAARLLLSMPPRRKRRWNEAQIDERLDQQVEDLFEWLRQLEMDEDAERPEPVVVGLSADGKAAWIEFYDRHAERIADASGDEAAVLSKIEGAAARISLVVHLIRQATGDTTAGTTIDERSVRAGISIAEWYADEATRVYSVLRETDGGRLQRQVLDLIERRGGTITANDLRRRSRLFDTSEDAERFLDGLVKAGIGSWQDAEPGETGGRPTREFHLSDSVSVSQTPKPSENDEVSDTDAPQSETGGWEEFNRFDGRESETVVSETSTNTGEKQVWDTDTTFDSGSEWEEIRI